MSRRVRTALAALLAVVFVVAGSSAAWALWTTSATTSSSTTIGKMSASISGTGDMTTTFSSTVTSVTKPVTMTNSGSIGGTTSTSVSVVTGSSTALAREISVVAWPVASTAACTASAPVGTGSVSGTWASLPSMSSDLAAGAAAVWCVRSTPTSSAPASSTTNVNIALTVVAGTWASTTVQGGFYMNTSASSTAAPALTCTDHSGNYVDVRWPTSSRPADTWYGAFVQDTQVGATAQDYSGFITIAPSDVPSSVATSGTQTVVVKVLDSAGKPTSTVAGSGTVTLFTQNDGAAIRCGA